LKDISDCPAFLERRIGDNAGNKKPKGAGGTG
jgi:hypothetical protein